MSNDFRGTNPMLRSDPELDRKIAECTNPEMLREVIKQHYAAQGMIVRTRSDDGFDVLKPQTAAAAANTPREIPPPVGYGAERYVYVGNTRIILAGANEADLDAQEAAIRGRQ